jgi:RNA polymerase sigma-70 factor (ECF subfamily)
MSGRLTSPEVAALSDAMDRYADGDEKAFADVYDLLAPRLLGYFCRQTGDSALAEDLTQQTLLQMHAARRNYATGSDVLPWAFAIAHNVLVDAYRRTRREFLSRATDRDAEALDLRVDRTSNPDEVAMTRQMMDAAKDALHRVPEPLRAAWDLVHQGFSNAETALALGITENAVKLRCFHVREAVRVAIDRDDECPVRRRPPPRDVDGSRSR